MRGVAQLSLYKLSLARGDALSNVSVSQIEIGRNVWTPEKLSLGISPFWLIEGQIWTSRESFVKPSIVW